MTSRKLATAVVTATMAGAAVLGMSAPAVAQYSFPGSIDDSTVQPGQRATVRTAPGSFTPGSSVLVTVTCAPSVTGTATAAADGSASFDFTLPSGTRPGACEAVFAGQKNGQPSTVRVSFQAVATPVATGGTGGSGSTGGTGGTGTTAAGAGSGTGARSSTLPRTGADQMVPLAITGIALVGVGAGIVVASRRRREDLPGGIA